MLKLCNGVVQQSKPLRKLAVQSVQDYGLCAGTAIYWLAWLIIAAHEPM
jgi:hypothetical protein